MNLNFLQKSSFWFLFSVAVIVALFLYGLQLDTNKSKLQKAEEEVKQARINLQSLNTKLHTLQDENTKINNSIKKKNELIQNLREKIIFLETEKYHQYGKGKGKLVLYKTCSDCRKMKVWVDGVEQGTLIDYFDDGAPSCYASGTISLIVDVGSHHIECKDKNGSTWETYIKVKEDECFRQGFRN